MKDKSLETYIKFINRKIDSCDSFGIRYNKGEVRFSYNKDDKTKIDILLSYKDLNKVFSEGELNQLTMELSQSDKYGRENVGLGSTLSILTSKNKLGLLIRYKELLFKRRMEKFKEKRKERIDERKSKREILRLKKSNAKNKHEHLRDYLPSNYIRLIKIEALKNK